MGESIEEKELLDKLLKIDNVFKAFNKSYLEIKEKEQFDNGNIQYKIALGLWISEYCFFELSGMINIKNEKIFNLELHRDIDYKLCYKYENGLCIQNDLEKNRVGDKELKNAIINFIVKKIDEESKVEITEKLTNYDWFNYIDFIYYRNTLTKYHYGEFEGYFYIFNNQVIEVFLCVNDELIISDNYVGNKIGKDILTFAEIMKKNYFQIDIQCLDYDMGGKEGDDEIRRCSYCNSDSQFFAQYQYLNESKQIFELGKNDGFYRYKLKNDGEKFIKTGRPVVYNPDIYVISGKTKLDIFQQLDYRKQYREIENLYRYFEKLEDDFLDEKFQTAGLQARNILEDSLRTISKICNINFERSTSIEQINYLVQCQVIPNDIADKFHQLRIVGNKAVHSHQKELTLLDVKNIIPIAHEVVEIMAMYIVNQSKTNNRSKSNTNGTKKINKGHMQERNNGSKKVILIIVAAVAITLIIQFLLFVID